MAAQSTAHDSNPVSRRLHEAYMQEALGQAVRALGRTAPNPAVGAVLIRDGQVVGRGHTLPPGGPHAEIVALRKAGDLAQGASLYVTLEPCSHYGRTPPCTEAIIAAGVREVYAAISDPYPEVNGRGLDRLRAAGLEVHTGLLARHAERVNEGFLKRSRTGLPFVTAKYAMTLDGRIATWTGHSRWVTGPEARLYVHKQRDRSDAILVGAGTVIADDPELTTRLPQAEAGWDGVHHPLRVVLDGSGRVPLRSRVLGAELPGRTLVVCTSRTSPDRIAALQAQEVEVMVLAADDIRAPLRSLLLAMGERGVNTLLVEGGGETLYSFFAEGLVDYVQAYIAPKLVGGRQAPAPLGGAGVADMSQAWHLEDTRFEQFGSDFLVEGYVVGRQTGSTAQVE